MSVTMSSFPSGFRINPNVIVTKEMLLHSKHKLNDKSVGCVTESVMWYSVDIQQFSILQCFNWCRTSLACSKTPQVIQTRCPFLAISSSSENGSNSLDEVQILNKIYTASGIASVL